MTISISPMADSDVQSVARLSGQLGYPATPQEIATVFREVRAIPDAEILVAKLMSTNDAVGWIYLYRHIAIPIGSRCEVGGLVVDEAHRGKQVGTQLLRAAEEWAKARDLREVRFTSRISRADAHRLYERLGYAVQKTSFVFHKKLAQ